MYGQIAQELKSPTFDIECLLWQFVAYPNGRQQDYVGRCLIGVQPLHMPATWKHIECFFRIQCLETFSDYIWSTNIQRGKVLSWHPSTMSFSELRSVDSLSISFEIQILRIISKENDPIFYDRNIVATPPAHFVHGI